MDENTTTIEIGVEPDTTPEYPEGVSNHVGTYGDEYLTLDIEDGYAEIDRELGEEDDDGKAPVKNLLVRFRAWTDRPKRAIRFTKRQFVSALSVMLGEYMNLWRTGNADGMTVSYRLANWGEPDTITATYRNRNERSLSIGGLFFTLTAAQFDTLKRVVNAVEMPKQRIEQGQTMEVRYDYTISTNVEYEVDDILDGMADTWTDPETGVDYWIVDGTEDEVREIFYEVDADDELPDRTWEWDYFEPEGTEHESFPEIEEHTESEEDDEDE